MAAKTGGAGVQKVREAGQPSRPESSGYPKRTIALVYDFDGTLSPKPMQEYGFLPKIDEDPASFWAEVNEKAHTDEAEGLIVYMHLMYKKAKAKGVEIRRDDLVALGADVELFEGVTTWFDEIDRYVRLRAETDVEIRHYVVSAGLKEIIEGTSIYRRFHNVFASEYYFEPYELPFPKRVITDTTKTQYLFRINKGVEELNRSINSHMPEAQRPVPFENMIYFGDGDTDVPSMAVMRQNGGYAVAVHGPSETADKCVGLYGAGRVDFYAPAIYTRGSELFHRTCLLVDRILADIRVREERWALEQSHGG